jgi:hypothetical protein
MVGSVGVSAQEQTGFSGQDLVAAGQPLSANVQSLSRNNQPFSAGFQSLSGGEYALSVDSQLAWPPSVPGCAGGSMACSAEAAPASTGVPSSPAPTPTADPRRFVRDYARANSPSYPVTTLRGESIFGLEAINNLERVDGAEPQGQNLYVGYRLRLNIDTTFFGKDRLRVRLQSRTLPELESITGSPLTNLSFDGDTFGRVEVSDLWYRFNLGKNTEINLTAAGGSLRDNVPVVNPLFYGSSRGSISVFGSEDPIVRSGSGQGLGISHDVTKALNLSAAYISRRADRADGGLFGDRNASILQLTYLPRKELAAAVALTSSLNDGFLRDQFEDASLVRARALSSEVYYRPWKHLALGARGGLIEAKAIDLPAVPMKRIASFAISVGFPDLARRGDLLGVVVGRPPAVFFDSEVDLSSAKPAHYELFYRYPISDVIAITPGGMYVEAPAAGGSLIGYWIGALRLTFQF